MEIDYSTAAAYPHVSDLLKAKKRYHIRMNRGAVIGLLILAGLVAGASTLTEPQLAVLGKTLISVETAIAADTRYRHVAQPAGVGCLWTKVDVVNTYDPCEGPSYDASGYSVGPVVPIDTYYIDATRYTYTSTDAGTWNYPSGGEVGASFTYSVPTNVLTEYPSSYGTVYSSASLANYTGVSIDPYGNYDYGTAYATPVYQDTWYTQAFPGVGQAIVPLLPPQYQPVGYGSSGYSIVAAQPYPTTYYPSATQPQSTASNPTCTIALSPASVQYGGSTVISWASQSATKAILNGFGDVPLSGSKSIGNQKTSQTIGLTVLSGARVGACYALLQVAAETLIHPNCIISSYPDRIQRGQSASIAWTANNAVLASLSSVGNVPREGGSTVTPSQTTTYTLTVQGESGGSTTCSTRITVL